jgi:hypothetical protein
MTAAPLGPDELDEVPLDTTTPNSARAYLFMLGGKDHYPPDRQLAEQAITTDPDLPHLVRDNRSFLVRSTRYLAQRGVRQFLDLGSGLPFSPNLHEVAQEVAPDSRVVYVDADPMVVGHCRALMSGHPDGVVDVIHADMRDVDAILEQAQQVLDFDEPVAFSAIASLHFLPDPEAGQVVERLRDRLPPGVGYLSITHATPGLAKVADRYQRAMGQGTPRTREAIAELFGDLELAEPGLIDPLTAWRPDLDPGYRPSRVVTGKGVAGVGRKPGGRT